jgi:hypothetical protein
LSLAYVFTQAVAYSKAIPVQPEVVPSTTRTYFIGLCVSCIRSFYEQLVAVDTAEYQNFTFVEWTRLIASIILLFRIIHSTSAESDIEALTQFEKYLELLSFRMHELSNSRSDVAEPPNAFCLWESVLKIVRDKYAKLMTDMKERAAAILNLGNLGNICPVLNGSIKQTEFWDDFTHGSESSKEADENPTISMAASWLQWDSLFPTDDQSMSE